MGCHSLLQCVKVKSEREVAQLCPTLSDPMDCSPPGSSIHGVFQARALEWGATAFSSDSITVCCYYTITLYYSITIESAPFKPGQVFLSIVSPPSSRHSPLASPEPDGLFTRSGAKLRTYSLMHSKILQGGDKHKGLPCSEVRLSPKEPQTEEPGSDSDSQNRAEKWGQRGQNGHTARVTGLRAAAPAVQEEAAGQKVEGAEKRPCWPR